LRGGVDIRQKFSDFKKTFDTLFENLHSDNPVLSKRPGYSILQRRSSVKKLYLCLLAIFCSQVVDADLNEDDKAFYAISSLRYHLNCLIKNERAEKPSNDIDFRDSDISALWRKASHGPHSDQIKTIQALYSKAIRPNKSINLDTLSQASDALEALWREINSAFRENNIASAGFNTSDYSRFFLPAEHRLRKALDGIFTHAYPTKNTSSLTSAGFKIICQRASTMVVASHKELNRYLIKAYMDDERKNATRSHQWLIKRCLGAENIRNLIRTKKIKHFTVPDKWIYILPGYDQFNDGNNALLVVSRVSVVSDDESAKA